MCGILGIRRSFLDDEVKFQSAVAAMEWRGPDGVSQTDAGEWRLAVARLAISDPDNGQPLWSRDGERVIAFNGAVTSAKAERRDFAGRLATGNDAELPLQRLETGGPSALLQTSGHYAFAIVEPALGRVWLGRDPEGEKPLYVVRRGDEVVAFASTLASLRCLGLPVDFDAAGCARFFRFGFGLQPALALDGLSLDGDLQGLTCYTDGAPPKYFSASSGHSGSSLTDALSAAVARCVEAEVPVGLCLSGGVDSACLAAVLAQQGRSLPAYQFQAAGSPAQERDRARDIAQHTGMEFRPVDVGAEILQQLPVLTRLAGMPLGDPSVLAAQAVAVRARADGVRILLSGEGADELFLGYRRHRVASRLPRRGPLQNPFGWPNSGMSMATPMRILRCLADERSYDALLEVAPPGFRQAVLSPELVAGHLPEGPAGSGLDRARHTDRVSYLRSDLLPKLDTALMASGIEGRCPFLDPQVVHCQEARASDPRSILGKRQLREAYRAVLPPGVLDGRKIGFGLPLSRWLREDDYLPDLLSDQRTTERPHIQAAGLRRMLDGHRAGRYELGHALYLVAAMECFLRYADVLEEAAS